MRQQLHPVEVSEQGYPMVKEPWSGTYNGYGLCCHDQEVPDTCEHNRNPAAYKYLRDKPPKGARRDVYGHRLPLPPPRQTFIARVSGLLVFYKSVFIIKNVG